MPEFKKRVTDNGYQRCQYKTDYRGVRLRD